MSTSQLAEQTKETAMADAPPNKKCKYEIEVPDEIQHHNQRRHHHHLHHHHQQQQQHNHNHLNHSHHHSHNSNGNSNGNSNSIGIVSPTKPSATSPCMKVKGSDNGTLSSIESSRSNALSANDVPMTGFKVAESINNTSPLKANKPIGHPKLNQQQQQQQHGHEQKQEQKQEQENPRCQDKSQTKSSNSASGSLSAFGAVSVVGKVLSLSIENSFIFSFYPFFLHIYSSFNCFPFFLSFIWLFLSFAFFISFHFTYYCMNFIFSIFIVC